MEGERGPVHDQQQQDLAGIVEKGDIETSEKEEIRVGSEAIRRARTLERQDSVDYASSLFLDSLNNESVSFTSSCSTEEGATSSSSSSSSPSSPDRENSILPPPAGHTSAALIRRSASGDNLLSAEVREGEDSDTETDILETVKPAISDSPDSREEGSYRREDCLEEEDNFLFDQDLDLEHFVPIEHIRPERLDTVEECSEPVSTTNSLPHDGFRWSSQNTSLTSADNGLSLTYWEEDVPQSLNSNTSKEEVYSVLEIEVRNEYPRKLSSEQRMSVPPPYALTPSDNGPAQGKSAGLWGPGTRPGPGPHSVESIGEGILARETEPPNEINKVTKFGDSPVQNEDLNKPEGTLDGFGTSRGTRHSPRQPPELQWSSDPVRNTVASDNKDEKSFSAQVTVSTDTVDRHIVTSYQINRGEVSIITHTEGADQQVFEDSSYSHQQQQQLLPSSLLVRQLEKVKDDIYRLLSEDSDASSLGGKEEESSIGEQVDCTELDSGVRGETEDSSQSIDLDIRTEKHEWEESEKVVVMVGMGCLGTDLARETDSGIERLSSAGGRPPGGSSNAGGGWMGKLGSRMRRARLGSGGHSTASSSPDDRRDRPRSASMESPREGGFIGDRPGSGLLLERPTSSGSGVVGSGGLEARVRELWVRLAQMEADKIKAVEQAVEQERRRTEGEWRRIEEDMARLEDERAENNRRREEAELRMRGAHEAQLRQVDLMNRLQAKLVKYRGEAEEARALIEELGGRNREDIETIARLRTELEQKDQQLNTQQVVHRSEVQEWQVRVEEAQEKARTLDSLNGVLRQERDTFRQEVEVLRSVVSSLESELGRSREEVARLQQGNIGPYSANTSHLRDANKTVAALRKECSDLKLLAIKEVGRMRVEMANITRMATTACLEVQTRSGVVVDSTGREVAVGNINQLWHRLQAANRDKQAQEAKTDNAERERDSALRKVKQLERQLADARQLAQLEASDPEGTEEVDKRIRLGRLEGENVLLRCSLQDIAAMVGEEMERSLTPRQGSRPRPITPNRTPLTPRRTRSASPGMAESTVAAVQAALNRKQVELYELQGRVSSLKEKLEQVTRSETAWEQKCKVADSDLARANQDLNAARSRAEEAEINLDSMAKKLVAITSDKDDMSAKWRQCKEELEAAESRRQELERQAEKATRTGHSLESEAARLQAKVDELNKELTDRGLLISQLERLGSSLREEAIELRERLAAVERDQERLERERTETETVFSQEKLSKTSLSSEVLKLRREEKVYIEKIQAQDLAEQKQRAELAASEQVIAGLKEEIADYERRLAQAEADTQTVRDQLAERDRNIAIIEAESRNYKLEKCQLENQLTGLSLKRGALEDQANHLGLEVRELKDHVEELSMTNALLNERKEQLEERLANRDRELADIKDKMGKMQQDLEQEMATADELKADLDVEEERAIDLVAEIEDKSRTIEQLNRQLVILRASLLEANTELLKLKEAAEASGEEEQRRLEKRIRRLEADASATAEEHAAEVEQLRSTMEVKMRTEVAELERRLKMEREKYEDEVDYFNQIIENLKAKNSEALLMAENSRHTADRLTTTEGALSTERVAELEARVEELTSRLSQERKESVLDLEKEKANSSELRVEVGKLKTRLEESIRTQKEERDRQKEELRKARAEKELADRQFFELRERLRAYEAQLADAARERQEAEDGRRAAEADSQAKQKAVVELEDKLLEKNKRIQEKIMEKHREVELLEKRLEITEKRETLLREEYEELKEVYEITRSDTGMASDEAAGLKLRIVELTSEVEALKACLGVEANSKSKEAAKSADLKKKCDDALFEKKKLEYDLKGLKSQMEEDAERNLNQIMSLERELEEGREKERQLERVRHDMERQINARSQEYGQLVLRLKGAEGRLKEMTDNVARLEAAKLDYEAKLSMVTSALQQRSRAATPSRHQSRTRYRSGDTSSRRETDEVDFIKTNLKDLSAQSERAEKEKADLQKKVAAYKQHNEQLQGNLSQVEEERASLEQRLASGQLQLAKLEKKVSMSDEILADREETIESLQQQLKKTDKRLREALAELDTVQEDARRAEAKLKEAEERSRRFKTEVIRLTEVQAETEDRGGRLEAGRKSLELEIEKLRENLEEKEALIKIGQSKIDRLREEVAGLETHCSNLTGQLNRVQGELDRSTRGEREMAQQVGVLEQELSRKLEEAGGSSQELETLRRRTSELDQERRLLEDRLDNAKSVASDMKRKSKEAEEKMSDLKRRLAEAEKGRREAEERLAQAGCNTGADNYLKDELNKARKENLSLQEKARELEKKIKIYKSEQKESRFSSSRESEKIVRTQIPLLSGRQQVVGSECGEHLVRIRILEQEAERHLRRVHSLEQQLADMERKTQERLEQAMQEKRQERERDHTRHTVEIRQLEHSLNSRERMYKERIAGLEDQVHTLRDQLGAEARSRRSFIASSQAISHDVSELRRQLDQSLDMVAAGGLDPALLDRESSRLQDTLGRYGGIADYSRINRSSTRFTPTSVIRSTGSLDNLDRLGAARPLDPVVTSTPLLTRQEPEFRPPLEPVSASGGLLRRSGPAAGPRGRSAASGLRRSLLSDFDSANVTT